MKDKDCTTCYCGKPVEYRIPGYSNKWIYLCAEHALYDNSVLFGQVKAEKVEV